MWDHKVIGVKAAGLWHLLGTKTLRLLAFACGAGPLSAEGRCGQMCGGKCVPAC